MGHHHDRLSLGDQPLEDLKNGFSGDTIQVAGWFVGDDHVRVVDQRPGNGDALFLSTGDVRRDLVSMVGDFDHLQQFERPFLADGGLVGTQKVGRQHDILHQAEGRHQLKRLVNDAQVFAPPQGELHLH